MEKARIGWSLIHREGGVLRKQCEPCFVDWPEGRMWGVSDWLQQMLCNFVEVLI